MKIVHIISGLGVGGAETTLLNLVRHTKNTNVSHTVICLSALAPLLPDFMDAGAKVRVLSMSRFAINPFLFARLIKWILEEKPDVVQTWMYHADLIGGVASKLALIIRNFSSLKNNSFKIIWGIHRSEVPINHGVVSRYCAKLCSLLSKHIPDRIVCCAQSARLSHLNFGYDDTRMTVIHNGFDTDKFTPNPEARRELLEECGLPAESLLIGIVGRFNPAKDYDNFLNAAAISARHLPRVQFVMVGKDVDYSNSPLRESIDRLGLAGKITLLGPRSDMAHLMAAFDLLCLSSRTEGFPTVIGEAMAAGTPCVATDVGDTKLLVGETGLVVPPRDSAALGLALEKMSLSICTESSIRARQRITDNFSIKSCWNNYLKIYLT